MIALSRPDKGDYHPEAIRIFKRDAVLFPVGIPRPDGLYIVFNKPLFNRSKLFQGSCIKNQQVVVIGLVQRDGFGNGKFDMPVFARQAHEYAAIVVVVSEIAQHFETQNTTVKVDDPV